MTEQCTALCDYYTIDEEEICFHKGDLITVVAKGSNSGFWEGYVVDTGKKKKKSLFGGSSSKSEKNAGGEPKKGLFPSCLVTSNQRPQAAPTFINKVIALYDYEPRDNQEMRLKKGDLVNVVKNSPSPGWWCGVNETNTGRVISQEGGHGVTAICGSTEHPLMFPSNFTTANVVQATFAFTARQNHELSFEKGDVVQVHRRWNDGWWEGIIAGKRGIFPSNYTAPNVCTLNPPLFCSQCKTIFQPNAIDCKACARNEVAVTSMYRALEDYAVSQTLPEYDLFAYIELDPKTGGKGALLRPQDIIKSAGGGLERGVAPVSSAAGQGGAKRSAGAATGEQEDGDEGDGTGQHLAEKDMKIVDEEIFNRRGPHKSALEALEEEIKRKDEAAALKKLKKRQLRGSGPAFGDNGGDSATDEDAPPEDDQ